ncbi:hypothetical protein HU200_063245 [Digitaria exilis]|uniref:FLZ-type domain-containing protein n=1 Tax=Digitaria exilis TaxID=1010633 RepID=A0A835A474_9POAL|nr:hypothetical protein HU200_063245 [Digitaria exilis]
MPAPSTSLRAKLTQDYLALLLFRSSFPALSEAKAQHSTASPLAKLPPRTMAASVACAFFFDAEPLGEPGRHALDACALCSKPLSRNSDIFMYKGDTPFCSEECRYEQMHHDAAFARRASGGSQRRRQQQTQRGTGRHDGGAAATVSAKADVSVASY